MDKDIMSQNDRLNASRTVAKGSKNNQRSHGQRKGAGKPNFIKFDKMKLAEIAKHNKAIDALKLKKNLAKKYKVVVNDKT